LIAGAWYAAADVSPAIAMAGALPALVGLAASEWAWVEAGQVVPLPTARCCRSLPTPGTVVMALTVE
jgi:hypothetical protein